MNKMSAATVKKLEHFVLICDRKSTKKFIDLLTENGARSIDTVYGKGSVKAGAIAEALGLDIEEKKAVISCLISEEKAKDMMEILCDKYKFHKAGTGFAFCTPVEGLVF